MLMKRLIIAAVIATVPVAHTLAQQPQLTNGQLQVTPLSGPLDRAINELVARQTTPEWVGYAVPIISGDRNACCWYSDGAGNNFNSCRLEPGTSDSSLFSTPRSTGSVTATVPLEPGTALFVLYRIEGGAIARIRVFSQHCTLDGGGRTVQWLTGVGAADSVAYLSTFITGVAANRKLADSALTALSMHAEPAALDRLVALARNGDSTHVRGQALFWLAQRAGEKAVGTISDAIERDPETDVKKKAVFALSQLPKDQGVPMLIDVARKNANPAVKKQAIFWLGQSKDPRALKFFEEILFK